MAIEDTQHSLLLSIFFSTYTNSFVFLYIENLLILSFPFSFLCELADIYLNWLIDDAIIVIFPELVETFYLCQKEIRLCLVW